VFESYLESFCWFIVLQYPITFRLVLGTGRQLLIGSSDDADRNDWMARINYASAFRTAGVRMRHAMPDCWELWLRNRTCNRSSCLNCLRRRYTTGDHRRQGAAIRVSIPTHLLTTRSLESVDVQLCHRRYWLSKPFVLYRGLEGAGAGRDGSC
jgi:hypothetical protein